MLNKVYLRLKKFMKDYYKTIIFLVICYFVFTFPLPYYIYAGGGTINIDDRVVIDGDKDKSKGSLNFAYVKELEGNVASFILGNIIPGYDIEKQENVELNEDETSEDVMFRNKIYLENANQTAIMLAYQKAGKEVRIKNKHFYIIYVEDKEEDGLRVGDELLKVNGKEIENVEDYTTEIQNHEVGEKIKVTVKRDDKEKDVTATIKEGDDYKVTGVSVSTIYEYDTNPKVELNFKDSEGGPSGGLMLTLAIYDKLTKGDLTNGLNIVGTGTISSDGTVGEIGGVKYKLNGAVKAKADLFLVPKGDNYKEALKEKEEHDYDIEIKAIGTFDEAVEYLESLKNKRTPNENAKSHRMKSQNLTECN